MAFNIVADIPSGPFALVVSRVNSMCSTSSSEHFRSSEGLHVTSVKSVLLSLSERGGMFVLKQVEKKLLIVVAFSASSEMMLPLSSLIVGILLLSLVKI